MSSKFEISLSAITKQFKKLYSAQNSIQQNVYKALKESNATSRIIGSQVFFTTIHNLDFSIDISVSKNEKEACREVGFSIVNKRGKSASDGLDIFSFDNALCGSLKTTMRYEPEIIAGGVFELHSRTWKYKFTFKDGVVFDSEQFRAVGECLNMAEVWLEDNSKPDSANEALEQYRGMTLKEFISKIFDMKFPEDCEIVVLRDENKKDIKSIVDITEAVKHNLNLV